MATDRLRNAVKEEAGRLKEVHKRNVQIFKQQPWREISGSFGDIGTFIPIFIALQGRFASGGPVISASSTLVFSGLANVLTGLFFGIPLPVQPMKAIAAVAISDPIHWSTSMNASAGLFVAGVIAILSWSGLIQWFTRKMPIPIVKGIQVGVGLSLMMSGFSSLPWRLSRLQTADTILAAVGPAVLALVLLLLCASRPRLPFVLILVAVTVVVGLVIIIIEASNPNLRYQVPGFSIWNPRPFVPTPESFIPGAFNAGLGQVPLTALNSIVAVVYLAEDLIPDIASPSATVIGSSVALMNLVGCWFKAMPVCHGSGGLAAQYRFGARSGASVIFLGLLKIILGLFASEFVSAWCQTMPPSILGILLILAGVELAKMGENLNGEGARDLWSKSAASSNHNNHNDDDYNNNNHNDTNDQEVPTTTTTTTTTNAAHLHERGHFTEISPAEKIRRYVVMISTIGAILGTRNDGLGFLVGLGVHLGYKFKDWEERRRAARSEGRIRLSEGGGDGDGVGN